MTYVRLDTATYPYAVGSIEEYINENQGCAGLLDEDLHVDREIVAKLPIVDGQKIIDVGCGFGRDVATIKDLFPSCELTGLDKQACLIAQCPDVAIYLCADFLANTFMDKQFDLAFANFLLSEFDETGATRVVSEMKRIATRAFVSDITTNKQTVFYEL